jgi:tape measure domain-containing protein
MSIKAGTAYVSIELTGLSALKKKIASEVTAGADAAGQAAGKQLSQSMTDGGAFSRLASSINSGLSSASAGLESFSRRVGLVGQQAMHLGVIMSTAFTLPIAGIAIAGAAIGIKFATQVEDARVALKALLPAGYDVVSLISRLQKIAIASPVFNSADLITFTQRMVAAGIEITKVEKFISAFGNIAVTVGIPMDKMTFALEAFSQMAGKGVVNMEELRQQLGDALPGALKIAADGLGVTQAKLFDMVKEGKVSADMLLDAFIKVGNTPQYLQGAATGADTLRSRWNQLKESVQVKLGQAVADNMDQIKQALADLDPAIGTLVTKFAQSLPSAIDGIGRLANKLADLANWYDNLSPKNKDLIDKLALILAVAGPVALALGGIGTAVGGIAGLLSVVISPFGMWVGIIGAVALGIFGLVKYFQDLYNSSAPFKEKIDSIVNIFKTDVLPIFEKFGNMIKSSFLDALKNISREFEKNKDNLEGIKTLLQAVGAVAAVALGIVFGIIVGVLKAIGPILTAVSSLVTGVMQIVIGVVNFLYDLFSGNFKKLDQDLRQIWNGLWDAIVGTVFNLGKAVWNFLSGFVEGIVGFFKHLYEVLVGHSIVPDLINSIISWFTGLPGRVMGAISGFVDSVISKFIDIKNRAVNAISDMVSQAASTAASLGGRILNAVGNLGSTLWNAGRALIQGLINGFESMVGSLLGRAGSIASSIAGTIAKAWDAHSPSRVAIKLGRMFTQGLAIGVMRDVQDIRSSLETAVRGATSVASSGLSSVLQVNADATNHGSPTLVIENYHASSNSDPGAEADRWKWLNDTRGW